MKIKSLSETFHRRNLRNESYFLYASLCIVYQLRHELDFGI